MLKYKAVEIFTNEEARYRNKPVADAAMQYIRKLKIAARCTVSRGVAGCSESGEISTDRLEVLSVSMPIRIYIIFPAAEMERVLDGLEPMVNDGIMVLHDLDVVCHRVRNAFFPRQLKVRDVMTADVASITTTTRLSDVVQLLLPSIFNGVPVLDPKGRPVGMVTQGDLIRKGGLSLRLGLLTECDEQCRKEVLNPMSTRQAEEIMTRPVIFIAESKPLAEAVDLMLRVGVKRLPVVDEQGKLSGMLSRLDIFNTVMRETPDWKAFAEQKVEVGDLKRVGDILRRDTHTVSPETTLDEVMRIIDSNDMQGVAVVDPQGKLLGLIADQDLLGYFQSGQEGFWQRLAKGIHSTQHNICHGDLQQCLLETTVGKVMQTDFVAVREDMLIENAISQIVEKGIKRLPVVDEAGCFQGMISRDSLLRTGFNAAM